MKVRGVTGAGGRRRAARERVIDKVRGINYTWRAARNFEMKVPRWKIINYSEAPLPLSRELDAQKRASTSEKHQKR